MDPKDHTGFHTFVTSIGGTQAERASTHIGDRFYRLHVSEAQARQAKDDIQYVEDGLKELLRNARDAHATRIYVATRLVKGMRELWVIDNGEGIADSYQDVIFEPYVTSRINSAGPDIWGFHGRGMALFSIKERFKTAQLVASKASVGSVFFLQANVSNLPERADQSVAPVAKRIKNAYEFIGPHNLFRTCLEFAESQKNRCSVYFGSPSQILATVAFHMNPAEQFTSSELTYLTNCLAFDLSMRTQARIASHEIKPLKPLCAQDFCAPPSAQARAEKPSHIKLGKAECRALANIVAQSVREPLASYYVEPGDVSVTQTKSELVVKIPLCEEGDE